MLLQFMVNPGIEEVEQLPKVFPVMAPAPRT
jgi:hypothetical protein